MDSSVSADGTITSSAHRVGLVIGIAALMVLAGFEAFSVIVRSSWWVIAAWPAFSVVPVVAIWQGLKASIEFDADGVRAQRYPWRSISLPWPEIVAIQGRSRGIHAVLRGSGSSVLLLEFGRYRRQMAERQAAVNALEQARLRYQS